MTVGDDPRDRRLLRPQFLALAVLALSLWGQAPGALVGLFGEDGLHLVLAKSLVMGEGLRWVHLPNAPPADLIPPLYPAILGVFGKLIPSFPEVLPLYRVIDAVLLAAAAWVLVGYLERLALPRALVYAAGVIGFVSVPALRLAAVPFAEPAFLLLWAGALRVSERASASARWAVLTGLLAGLASLTVGPGFTVLLGVMGAFALRRNVRAAAVTAAAGGAVLVPWLIWSLVHRGGADVVRQAIAQSRQLETSLGFLPSLPLGLWYVVGFLVVFVIVRGAVAMWRPAPALVLSFGFFFAAVLLWRAPSFRWLWISWPWAIQFLCVGMIRLWGERRVLRVPVGAFAVVLAMLYLPWTALRIADRSFLGPLSDQGPVLVSFLTSVAAETPGTSVLASDIHAPVHLYTGRLTVPLEHPVRDPDTGVGPTLCARGATHVAVVHPLPDAAGPRFEPVFQVVDGPALFAIRCAR